MFQLRLTQHVREREGGKEFDVFDPGQTGVMKSAGNAKLAMTRQSVTWQGRQGHTVPQGAVLQPASSTVTHACLREAVVVTALGAPSLARGPAGS